MDFLWLIAPCIYYMIALAFYRFGNAEIFYSQSRAIVFSLLWPVWLLIMICAVAIMIAGGIVFVLFFIGMNAWASGFKFSEPENIKTGTPF